MNANGQRFWMLSDAHHWFAWNEPSGVTFDRKRRSLRLASYRALPEPAENVSESVVLERVERPRQAIDPFGGVAYWHADSSAVRARSSEFTADVEIYRSEQDDDGASVTDLVGSTEGILYLAIDGDVVLHDLRGRFEDVRLTADDFAAWRLAPIPEGGVWILDRTRKKLARALGRPLPSRPHVSYSPTTWRPEEENETPPRIARIETLSLEEGETPVAIATSQAGTLALLTWNADGDARIRLRAPGKELSDPVLLMRDGSSTLKRPYTVGWVSEARLAVLVIGLEQAAVFDVTLGGAERLVPVGDVYPLRDHNGGPFLNGYLRPVHYPMGAGRSSGLQRLSLPSFSKSGEGANYSLEQSNGRWQIDSGSVSTIWHRLYVDAAVPKSCGIRVFLAASERATPPERDAPDWFEHRFGDVPGSDRRTPKASWVPSTSEVAFHPGLVPCPIEEDRAGLFTVLIQRGGRRVSALRGRYLWVRVELVGNGRETPELFGLRAYASRFSYVENYLPELYRETEFGPEADATGEATRSDFLERFLNNFEGTLTSLEDRIAASYVLTSADSAPVEGLPWLASWLGLEFEPALGEVSRRAMLKSLPELYDWHGTLRGLSLALDLATSGGVRSGEIVIVENYRLARTFATILGADLADEEDPLLAGLVSSGNSFVGDTLFLGEETEAEFLAIFRPEVASESEEDAIGGLFGRLAHRVTVLVRTEQRAEELGLIRRVAEQSAPAHVQVSVFPASEPLRVGLYSLVGVDTYLTRKTPRAPVELGRSHLGVRDFLDGASSLDPRIGGGNPPYAPSRPPEAVMEDVTAELGESVALDGSQSRAFDGRGLARFRWTWTGTEGPGNGEEQ